MHRSWILGAGLALLAATNATAAQQVAKDVAAGQPSNAQYEAWAQERTQLGRAIAASGRPRSLYAAWLLAPLSVNLGSGKSDYSPEADAWFARAVRTGAGDPLIAQAAIGRCVQDDYCDVEQARATLETTDVDDIGSQLLLMQLANKRQDPRAADLAWQRAARATQYRDPLMALVGLLDDATADQPVAALAAASQEQGAAGAKSVDVQRYRVEQQFSAAAAHVPFPLREILKRCDAPVGETLAQCRHVLEAMANSGSLLLASIGVARLERLETDTASKAQWQARGRQLQWLSMAGSTLLGSSEPAQSELSLSEYMQLTRTLGELPAIERLVQAHGMPLQPPADWQPISPKIE